MEVLHLQDIIQDMEDNFDLKKYLAEGKLLKEGMSLKFYDEDVELNADSGDYIA